MNMGGGGTVSLEPGIFVSSLTKCHVVQWQLTPQRIPEDFLCKKEIPGGHSVILPARKDMFPDVCSGFALTAGQGKTVF